MNFYPYYQTARNLSWKVLNDCNITRLPVDLSVISIFYRIEIVAYSKSNLIRLFTPEALSGDGFIAKINDRKVIFFNDQIKTVGRRRFTIAHELGHALLEHPIAEIVTRNSEIDSTTDPIEMQANVFARDVLAPACVLDALNVSTVEDIMRFCNLSYLSSEIRLKRLTVLRKRGNFFMSPEETKVYNNFAEYINNYKL